MDPPVAVGRQFGDPRLDLCHKLIVRQWRPTDRLLRPLVQTLREVRAGDTDHFRHSRSCFLSPVACSSASLRSLDFQGLNDQTDVDIRSLRGCLFDQHQSGVEATTS